ncbi:MAG: hypothetical protein SGILL_004583 [Bacillariaceae sp.]
MAPTEAAITTEFLSANGLNFTCSVLQHTSEDPDAPVKEIMLLHGFPMFRVWWLPLLEHWDVLLERNGSQAMMMSAVSVHAVACDLRGYSPGASPDGIENYDYSLFAEDTFALAEAAGFADGFHLMGHDHGAGLAWYVAANDPDNKILSLTTLSVPHVGLMSDALCSNNTVEDQVIASNYFNQFSLPDSAFASNASLTDLFESFGFPSLDPAQFQKMLWWYNGSLAKHFSMPRVVSDEEVQGFEDMYGFQAAFFLKSSRAAIPMEERACIPIDEENRVGTIAVPTLFICGLNDFALLCNDDYVTDFPPELLPDYEHANFECGHDFFLEGNCNNLDESQAVMDKITAFVFATEHSGENETMPMPTSEPSGSEEEGGSGGNTPTVWNLARALQMAVAATGVMMM